MDKFGCVYKVDIFKEKGDITPYQNNIFLHPEDTDWIFETKQWADELIKIEYARIPKNSEIYLRASITSKAMNEIKEKSPEMATSER